MGLVKCEQCDKELTPNMEIEYSRYLTRIFCSHDCAIGYYFEYAGSTPVDCSDLSKEDLAEFGIKVVGSKIFTIE